LLPSVVNLTSSCTNLAISASLGLSDHSNRLIINNYINLLISFLISEILKYKLGNSSVGQLA